MTVSRFGTCHIGEIPYATDMTLEFNIAVDN